jgi:hypothetical protein
MGMGEVMPEHYVAEISHREGPFGMTYRIFCGCMHTTEWFLDPHEAIENHVTHRIEMYRKNDPQLKALLEDGGHV